MFQPIGPRTAPSTGSQAIGNERLVRLKKEIHKQLVTRLHLPSIGTSMITSCAASCGGESSSFAMTAPS